METWRLVTESSRESRLLAGTACMNEPYIQYARTVLTSLGRGELYFNFTP